MCFPLTRARGQSGQDKRKPGRERCWTERQGAGCVAETKENRGLELHLTQGTAVPAAPLGPGHYPSDAAPQAHHPAWRG